MRRCNPLLHWLPLGTLLVLTAGCGGGAADSLGQSAPVDSAALPTEITGQPDPVLQSQLTGLLLDELERLGKDPGRSLSSPPAGNGNAVFNLAVSAVAPDGGGEQGSSQLIFYPRMIGDYDGNGEVGISDITPLGLLFGQTVDYDDPALHGGFAFWPSGDPDGEGRANWLRARVDGDGNGEINAADITPIAIHFGEHADGWRVEQRFGAEEEFGLLPNPDDEQAEFSVAWSGQASGSIGYQLDGGWPGSGYLELRVQAWETASGSGGPLSDSTIFEFPEAPCTADLQVNTEVADFPFEAAFTAIGSSVVADSYLMDFGDGNSVELDGLWDFPAYHTYTAGGIYEAVLTVTCGTDVVTDSIEIMATPLPCDLQTSISATPDTGFAPLTVLFSAVGTTPDADSYILDFDDGSTPQEVASLAELMLEHEYTDSGTFNVTLTAFCENGGSEQTVLPLVVGSIGDDCSVNLGVVDPNPLIDTDAQFTFSGTSGNFALLDFGDGSDVLFVNLLGPEPILHTYTAVGTYIAELKIICEETEHTDAVFVHVKPEPVLTFDVTGKVWHYQSNPVIGSPEPAKDPLPGAEIEIYNSVDDVIVSSTTTDAEGAYFFDGDSLGLDVTKIYIVRPTQAEMDSRLPLGWFPGQAIIVIPEPDELKVCSDINLLATPT
ncbi:MAG: PKD domain-containing protein [bacterium]